MQLTKTHKILIGLITVAILVGLVIKFTKKSEAPVVDGNNSASSTSIKIPGTNLSLENGDGKYTVTPIPVEETKAIPVPDLNRSVSFSSITSLNDDAKKILIEKITALQTSLKKDPKNISNWILLGTDYKIAGDYNGAAMSWKYAADVSNDYISLGNLGNLYAYYLKDNAMAEIYYKKAINRAPAQAYLYLQLADVYKVVFKDIAKAKAIVDEGLKQIPNDPSLLDAKKNLQ